MSLGKALGLNRTAKKTWGERISFDDDQNKIEEEWAQMQLIFEVGEMKANIEKGARAVDKSERLLMRQIRWLEQSDVDMVEILRSFYELERKELANVNAAAEFDARRRLRAPVEVLLK
ncbi:hypothetical protein LTR56_001007 [Elasticomyces elasticus]|nr:hypothetical protein LTR22_013223 [Elasticomyces elasticus]KAK3660081.1 hypothetical protein LTR56_001007 [Elasticomyces elasticus]KAK4911082.1 hypothetical protein LTR49_020345 [Elasticomyces elasticus]KAK5750512.1 hypothetical protein LTS12_019388 [Elasticomyces elasticus]